MTGIFGRFRGGHYGETVKSISSENVLQRGHGVSVSTFSSLVAPQAWVSSWWQVNSQSAKTNNQREKSAKFVAKIVLFCHILSPAVLPCDSPSHRKWKCKQQKGKNKKRNLICYRTILQICAKRDITILLQSYTTPLFLFDMYAIKLKSWTLVTSVYLKLSHILSQSAVLLKFKCQIQSIKKEEKKPQKQPILEARTAEGIKKRTHEDYIYNVSIWIFSEFRGVLVVYKQVFF